MTKDEARWLILEMTDKEVKYACYLAGVGTRYPNYLPRRFQKNLDRSDNQWLENIYRK